ncbi:MAG: hypothetical protein NC041_04205 [Bacteroides sp.]|nr:hypothetical protein [Prevotella sp.]MCM1407908.1 hypothetical protein [Treponema brennaborense]MCM1469650.1 hypothetical protein [Bacteroides sp.]
MDSVRIIPYPNPEDVPDKETMFECVTDQTDEVERSDYVSPDKKIESFIHSGVLLQNMNASGGSYELDGSETEADPDSPAYREELERDAESLKGSPLPQHFDKIDALEVVESIEKQAEVKENNARVNETRAQEFSTSSSADSVVSHNENKEIQSENVQKSAQ